MSLPMVKAFSDDFDVFEVTNWGFTEINFAGTFGEREMFTAELAPPWLEEMVQAGDVVDIEVKEYKPRFYINGREVWPKWPDVVQT